ncbi:MAG: fibronectin type III domain-containing protein, partial [Methanomassiliicoccales archaeon]|nr:fibronectin type III domain-containing protein [Methanomassiliicoccales archaeon]
SSVTATEMQALSVSLSAFSSQLASSWAVHEAAIRQARSRAESFEYEMFVDLYDFAYEVKTASITTSLTDSATQVMQAVDAAVLYEASGSLRPGAHGLAIYFPDVISDLNLVGYRSDATLASVTTWDEFLDIFFNGGGAVGVADDYEDDDSYLQASLLTLGQPQYHSLTDGGADVDWSTFQLAQASDIVVQTSGVSGDTELFLYNSSGVPTTEMAYDDDGGVGYFSRIVASLAAGTYYVKVTEYGGNAEIGNYELQVRVPSAGDAYEPDDDAVDASELELGSSQAHSIGDGGADVDWAWFVLDTSLNVRVETWGTVGDTRIWLYVLEDGYLYEVDSDDDTGVGLFSLISQSDLAAGEYYVMVEEYYNDNEIPEYTLNLTAFSSDDAYESDDTYQTGTSLVPGQDQAHSIGDGGADVDWYIIELYSSSRLVLETYGVEGDTILTLFSSSGVPSDELAMDDDSGNGYFSMLDVGPLDPGTYYAMVEAYQGFFFMDAEPIPQYGIRLQTVASAPQGLEAVVDEDGVSLSWQAPSTDGGNPIVGYEVLRSSWPGATVFYRSVAGTSFRDVNVSSGADYYYTVRAVTSFGKGAASTEAHVVMSGTMVIPGPVSSVQTECHADRIVLSWQAPADNGSPITVYHVLCGQQSDGSDRAEVGTTATTSFTHQGLAKGTTYYYWVVAENANGMGQTASSTKAVAEEPPLGAGTMLMWVLAGVGVLAVVAVLVVLLSRGKRSRAQAPPGQGQLAYSQGRCPSCGAPVQGQQFCGNCGRRLP